MYKYVVSILIVLFVATTVVAQCPENINNSPGNSPLTVEANVYDQNGDVISTITCERTGNSQFIDCELDSYNFPSGSYIVINLGNPPNDVDCYYDTDGNSIQPLPVDVVDFNISTSNKINYVSWETTTETNNDFFTLEFSSNGEDFEFVKDVPGAGNSFTINNYQVTHRPIGVGQSIVYYRLSQTDYNGTKKNLGVKAIQVSYSEAVSIYSNSSLIVYNDFSEKDIDAVQVFDYTGRMVKEVIKPVFTSLQFELPNNAMYIFNTIYKEGTVNSVKVIH